MTDRIQSIFVILEKDTREDDVAYLCNAIRQLRGVLSVRTDVAGSDVHVARMRVRHEILTKIAQLVDTETSK